MLRNLPHIHLVSLPEKSNFTSNPQRGAKNRLPPRNRAGHSSELYEMLQQTWDSAEEEIRTTHSTNREGIYIEFRGEANFKLVTKSLEDMRSKQIRLLNVRQTNDVDCATVYVAHSKKEFFFKKIKEYAEKNYRDTNTPSNKKLVESISNIQKALLIESFWLDSAELIPENVLQWCEVWLRNENESVISSFEELLIEQNITSKAGHISFPERAVKLIQATREDLEELTKRSDYIAEYRKAKETALFYSNMENRDQVEWIDDLLTRQILSEDSNTTVCILDTGVNNGHPLLSTVLPSNKCQAVITEWGSYDHDKHGTLMAGLSAYGNLQELLSSNNNFEQVHSLESVKILPNLGSTEPELWGDITTQAVSKAEIESPEKKRIICMAITSNDTRDNGRPSSWSGAIDQLCSGALDAIQRAFIVSAGNPISDYNEYPSVQLENSIHDPSQAWNAITVGAYTELVDLTSPELDGYVAIAPQGGLSPFTTTSYNWDKMWPLKPEIVMEGGNLAEEQDTGFYTECDDLSLVSTYYNPQEGHFYPFSMTSAATAQASWFLAQIQAQYPHYWPETLRALIIHSAEWTSTMKRQFNIDMDNKSSITKLLRICGYGVPDINRAMKCASNSLTLVAQNTIQPYDRKYKTKNSREVKDGFKTKEMHLYELPWPKEILENLPPETNVQMRVTLSYFIEPSPGGIGWKDRYRYVSHALRFDINSPGESKADFIIRINAAAREDDDERSTTSSASRFWVIGQARDKGSVHSDIWKGYASDLAASNLIAVFPLIGWWRERSHLNKWNMISRYALIISITTPEQNIETSVPIDIYTPVLQQISVETDINI